MASGETAAHPPRPCALITGASSGIGEALAWELAQRGHDLVVVARDGERLAQLARRLAEAHGATVKVLSRDLSDPAAAHAVAASVAREQMPVTVLVNNAGFGIHGPFMATDLVRELALVHLQIDASLMLTKACLPGMIRRGGGKILNVASVYAYAPVAGQAVYAACKAFLLSFSGSLGAELQGSGVSVTVLCPGITATAFRSRAGLAEKATRLSMDPRAVASIACRGLFQGKPVVVPGAVNGLYVLASRVLPQRLMASVTGRVNRRRGLRAAS